MLRGWVQVAYPLNTLLICLGEQLQFDSLFSPYVDLLYKQMRVRCQYPSEPTSRSFCLKLSLRVVNGKPSSSRQDSLCVCLHECMCVYQAGRAKA